MLCTWILRGVRRSLQSARLYKYILNDALFTGGTDYKQSDKVQIQLGGAYMNLLFFQSCFNLP